MKVAIAQVDGKWPNLALAKLTAWHRARGDKVEHFMPLSSYDRVYASKVFSDTPDDAYLPMDAVIGGTGYGTHRTLNDDIEATRPDFSLWPHWQKSMGFSTRGCVRRCPFCVVPEKEGRLRVVAEFGDIWDGQSSECVLLDNNVTAASVEHFSSIYADAALYGVKVDFRQGFDVRLWTEEHLAVVGGSPSASQYLHFAFDSPALENDVRGVVRGWREAHLHPDRLVFYVLVGFDTTPEEDMYRIDLLTSLGANPFVMPYNRSDRYQRRLARWCNSVVVRKSCTFAEFVDNTRVVARNELADIMVLFYGADEAGGDWEEER
jgi:hypothetical protein